MVTSIGQYAPVFLPGEPPSLTEKPGRPQPKGLQSQTLPKWPCGHDTRLFLPVEALPQWGLSMKLVQLLGLQRPWWCQVCRDMDSSHSRSYGPVRLFFGASCSWRSEGLFSQSFSIPLPVQALRRLPCLGSFSVVRHVRHTEGAPWLGFYSVDWHIRHLKGHPE